MMPPPALPFPRPFPRPFPCPFPRPSFYQSAFQQNVLDPADTTFNRAQPGGGPLVDLGDARTQQVTLVNGRLVSGTQRRLPRPKATGWCA